MPPSLLDTELTTTTREGFPAFNCGRRLMVRKKWPKWFATNNVTVFRCNLFTHSYRIITDMTL